METFSLINLTSPKEFGLRLMLGLKIGFDIIKRQNCMTIIRPQTMQSQHFDIKKQEKTGRLSCDRCVMHTFTIEMTSGF